MALRCALLLLVAASAVQTAQAAGTVDEHRPLAADGRVYVNNFAGTLALNVWERNEVYLRGELDGEAERVELSGGAADLSIVVKTPAHTHAYGEANLQLTVPAGAQIVLETVSADVAAAGLRGPLKINTVSGIVQLQMASSPELTVSTVSGDVILRGPVRSSTVKTVSGDLHLNGQQGKLAAETVSGNLELDGGRFSEVRLKSISGDMRLDLSLTERAQLVGDTLSGDITLEVPADVSGTAMLKSFSGATLCDSPDPDEVVAEETGRPEPGRAVSHRRREYIWGDGAGARVELSSFSGDIHVERKATRGTQTPPPFIGRDRDSDGDFSAGNDARR